MLRVRMAAVLLWPLICSVDPRDDADRRDCAVLSEGADLSTEVACTLFCREPRPRVLENTWLPSFTPLPTMRCTCLRPQQVRPL